MKKVLFISVRNPYSDRYSGDIIGSKKIINTLKKKYALDIATIGEKNSFSKKNIFIFKKANIFLRFCYSIKSLISFQPIQFGFFYSNEMQKFINDEAINYDLIFFYHIRSSQYLPENYFGKKIIEMGDLYSVNYRQTFNALNYFNPLRYIYFIESVLIGKLEKKIFMDFDKIILFSKNEIKKLDKQFIKKITHINITAGKIKKKFVYSKKNKNVLFVGNLKYLPNILAVKNFVKKILPKLKEQIPDIKFEVIGEISKFNKFLLSLNKNVECRGIQKNLDKFIKGSFCGVANLSVATGVQGKILSYMSYGLPVVCSKKVARNFNNNVISYKDDNEFTTMLKKLHNNKKLSNQFSKKSLNYVKKLSQSGIRKEYLKIVKI